MVKIGPSLMCADMGNLENNIKRLHRAGSDFFHFDVMDGDFVPNFTMGPDMIKALRPYTDIPFDVHLMIYEPEKYIQIFADAGANMISIHAEATIHLQKTLQLIKDTGLKAGVVLNPATPLSKLDYIWDVVDYVVIMSVNPGFSGQKFIPLIFDKIREVSELIKKKRIDVEIQVDGNVSHETIPKIIKAGGNMLVCGTSSLFLKNSSLEQAMEKLHSFL